MEHLQEDWIPQNLLALLLVISAPHKTITTPLEEVALNQLLEMWIQLLQTEVRCPQAEMQLNRQDRLLHRVAQVEDTIILQAEALTTQIRIVQLAVHLTIDHPEQIRAPDPPLLMEEVSLMGTTLEIHKVDPLLILPVIAPQADQVLELVIALQVEVQVDPQVAQAQEDPEEGGINSPFFLENLSKNDHNFVTNPT